MGWAGYLVVRCRSARDGDYAIHAAPVSSVLRRGITLIELLVALSITGFLLALVLVAVQQARESARRTQCAANLREFGVAMQSYESQRGVFPPGWWKRGYSLHVALLPYMSRSDVYDQIDSSEVPRRGGDPVRGIVVNAFLCPTDAASGAGLAAHFGSTPSGGAATHYAGNFGTGVQKYGYNGMFHHLFQPPSSAEPLLSAGSITDGLSNTAAMSEILVTDGSTTNPLRVNWNTPNSFTGPDELETFASYCECLAPGGASGAFARGRPWIDGEVGYTLYNHMLPPNRMSCRNGTNVQLGAYTAASLHQRGVNLLVADARVSFVVDSVDLSVWRAFGSRNGKD